jgi:hypothetical protein
MMLPGRHVVVMLATLSVSLPGLRLMAQQTQSLPWAEFGVSVATTTETIFVLANPIPHLATCLAGRVSMAKQ